MKQTQQIRDKNRTPLGHRHGSAVNLARQAAWVCLAAVGLLSTGCGSSDPAREVVIYTALDAEFSEPILDDYEQQSGVDVRANFDVESTKTVGLVTRIIAEQERPRCDVFWNNEILHTLRLQKLGLLEPLRPQAAEQLPSEFCADDGSWFGFAARARVLLVNRDLVAENEMPDSILDLVDPRWKNRVGVAKPLFGTTASHAAVLFSLWGEEDAQAFFLKLKEQAQVLGGNKQVAEAVGQGRLAFGLTDTDDAIIELEKGRPVTLVFPDQQDDQMGTLFIPNTVCLLRNAPNPDEGRRLIEAVLSAATEVRLARGPSAQIPLRRDVAQLSRVQPDDGIRTLVVDFAKAADAWETAAKFLNEHF